MLYQKDPKYAHLPHSEWLKTPDGERWRQASQKWSQEFSAPAAGPVRGGRPEDRIRDLMGRRPVSERGPVTSGPGRPSNQPEQKCYPSCPRPDGSQDMMCNPKPCPRDLQGGGTPSPPSHLDPHGPMLCTLRSGATGLQVGGTCRPLGQRPPNWGPGAWDDSAGRPQWRPANDKTKPGWSAGMTQYQR
jgi:hypothetical protein